jgi:erythromycin esterase-like protein
MLMTKFGRRKAMSDTNLAVINNVIREAAHPVTMASEDYDPLIELIGDAHFVLIGEASHGTHEFYQERASITKRLITEKGFTAVAVEADWPDAYRVNRYVRGIDDDNTPPRMDVAQHRCARFYRMASCV